MIGCVCGSQGVRCSEDSCWYVCLGICASKRVTAMNVCRYGTSPTVGLVMRQMLQHMLLISSFVCISIHVLVHGEGPSDIKVH